MEVLFQKLEAQGELTWAIIKKLNALMGNQEVQRLLIEAFVPTLVEGIGINRVTANFEAGRELVDDAVRVSDEQACRMARWLVEHDGVFAGSSSAVNCVAAVVTAMGLPEGSTVVTILCDAGTRHLSKFYRHVAEMGLEENDDKQDLFTALGITKEAL